MKSTTPTRSLVLGAAAWAPAVALVAMLAGCATTPPSSSSETKANAASGAPGAAPAEPAIRAAEIDHDGWAKLGYRLDWQSFAFNTGSRTPQYAMVAPFDDAVLALEKGSFVSLMEPRTGAVRWTYEVASPLTRFVGLAKDPIDPSRFLVMSESEVFTLAGGTGAPVKRQRFDRVVNTKPILERDLSIFGTTIGEVMAHSATTGMKAWGFTIKGAISGNPVRLGDGGFGVVSQAGEIAFLTFGGNLTGRARILKGIATNPVTDGTHLIVAGLDQSIWAFDSAGRNLWRYRTASELAVQPTAHAGTIYCEVPGRGLVALDSANGSERWVAKGAAGTVIASRAGRLVAWDGSTLRAIDAARGDVLETVTIKGATGLTTDTFEDGAIYATFDGGSIARFVPRQ